MSINSLKHAAQIDANNKAFPFKIKSDGWHSCLAGNDIGSAFAKMIVEGESFSQAMHQMMIKVAEQFIEKVISMIIEWAILQAVMDIWPGGALAIRGWRMPISGCRAKCL